MFLVQPPGECAQTGFACNSFGGEGRLIFQKTVYVFVFKAQGFECGDGANAEWASA